MSYLVRDGKTFVSPQYNLTRKVGGKSWSCCPDFIAINPYRKLVSVVEVSTGSNTSKLAKKTNNWCSSWGSHLKSDLVEKQIIDGTWDKPVQVRIFIREDQENDFLKRINSRDRVKVETIEHMWCRWRQDWWDEKLTQADSE